MDYPNFGIVRARGRWWYNGRSYDSLRHLKTRSLFKLERVLGNELAKQIRIEIDREILENFKRFEEET